MKRRYELPISTSYVPDWTIMDGLRELFQNAIDQEITSKKSSSIKYDPNSESLSIKTYGDHLSNQSLLLGCSTKSNNEETIGKHGEGYKIAFMVLLRNNKKIDVINKTSNDFQIWSVHTIRSTRYNSEIPVIDIDSMPNTVDTDNFVCVTVSGITPEEWDKAQDNTLVLRDPSDTHTYKGVNGRILLDERDSNRIYVNGLYVCNGTSLTYGYDFSSSIINLDRDRKLIDSFDISWNSSKLWVESLRSLKDKDSSLYEEAVSKVSLLIKENSSDTNYIANNAYNHNDSNHDLGRIYLTNFKDKYGSDAIPCKNYEEVKFYRARGKVGIEVDSSIYDLMSKSGVFAELRSVQASTLIDDFLSKYKSELTDDQINDLNLISDQISNCSVLMTSEIYTDDTDDQEENSENEEDE